MISVPVPREPSEAVAVVEAAKVRGVLLLSVYSQGVRDALTGRWPVVMFFEPGRDEPLASIQPDDFTAGYLATRHLVEQGHRRIIVAVGGGKRPVGFSHRFAGGHTLAMSEAGLAVDNDLIVRDGANLGPFNGTGGVPPAGPRLVEMKPRPTAIIGRQDTVVGVMRVLFRAGLKVPEDVSVVAYGPEGEDAAVSPELTRIEFSPREMAEAALSALAAPERIRSTVTMPVWLRKGDSVKKIKAGRRRE
jgi:DNA-binding LacI/PurR family transcriptional regulator